ncbi:MAG: sulfurtransferase-like selenium metabolism protein YedF [Bacillota bacterium]
MKRINAKGLDCPKPVVLTKNALKENKEVITIVDNEAAANNVKKLANKLGAEAEIKKIEDNYEVNIKKTDDNSKNDKDRTERKIYFFKSDKLGQGEDELGNVLIKGFLHTLLEVKPLPQKLIFMNSGVKIVTENEDAIDSLKELEERGVTILSCGTCLDYYGLEDKLDVGEISNMYEIVESLNDSNVITI